jgi:hypothetical protein
VEKMECIDTSMKNLSQIRLWFARTSSLSVEYVFPTVTALLKDGK